MVPRRQNRPICAPPLSSARTTELPRRRKTGDPGVRFGKKSLGNQETQKRKNMICNDVTMIVV